MSQQLETLSVCVQQEGVCGLCVHMMAALQHDIKPLAEHLKYLKKQVPAGKTHILFNIMMK